MATAATGKSSAAAGGGRRAEQGAATRARLYQETVKEFTKRGVAGTEIAVIAERVGITRGAFYVHFADKDHVLRELLMAEEQLIADGTRSLTTATDGVTELFGAVVDTVLDAEQRIGRRLVRDLCAAQFRPEFAQLLAVDDHPLGLMLVDEITQRAPDVDPVDLTMVFLTGLFGLLATDDGPPDDRRRRLDLLIESSTHSVPPTNPSAVPSTRRRRRT